MKRQHIALFLLIFMLCIAVLPTSVIANSAEPPLITVRVVNAPEDMTMSFVFFGAGDALSEERHDMKGIRRGWETYYRLGGFGSQWQGDAKLLVRSAAYNFSFTLTEDALDDYNNIFTLDLATGELKDGNYFGRYALIVAIRVLCTLVMEGVILWLFGYRTKRSLLCFLIINLITQAGVNIALYGADANAYALLGFYLVEVLVFLSEMIAFPLALREGGRGRAILFAFVANLVSLLGGATLIANLPV